MTKGHRLRLPGRSNQFDKGARVIARKAAVKRLEKQATAKDTDLKDKDTEPHGRENEHPLDDEHDELVDRLPKD